MDNTERFDDTKELIEKYFKLQAQIDNPTRSGMIEALSDAKNVARLEIISLEKSQGDTYQVPLPNITDTDLYCKLSLYQQGLYNHAVNKYGEEAFKRLLAEHQ